MKKIKTFGELNVGDKFKCKNKLLLGYDESVRIKTAHEIHPYANIGFHKIVLKNSKSCIEKCYIPHCWKVEIVE